MTRTTEAAFESVIEAHLLANGYVSIGGDSFDRDRAIFPQTVLGFIRETQATDEWAKLEAQLGEQTGEQVLADLCRRMDDQGALATLRHGFKCYGRTLRIAYFKAAHELNPELEARYAANVVGVTRQLRFSPRSEQSLDVVLSVNGVPVATLELKNPLHRADCRARPPPVPAGPRPERAHLRLQAAHVGSFRQSIRNPC